ncbi:hypothetical protein AGMMS49921_07430 [Endomicrobiia bacterium]|nr:hypothetical protein AGMMS49921_07220 [Endomicrobiia bacterium]GHT42388.1 hypothetical protein AGMMS49921_07430 [Endomicrobiia bacterium]
MSGVLNNFNNDIFCKDGDMEYGVGDAGTGGGEVDEVGGAKTRILSARSLTRVVI